MSEQLPLIFEGRKQRARHFKGSNPKFPEHIDGKSMRISCSHAARATFDSLSALGRGDFVEIWYKEHYLPTLERVKSGELKEMPKEWFRKRP